MQNCLFFLITLFVSLYQMGILFFLYKSMTGENLTKMAIQYGRYFQNEGKCWKKYVRKTRREGTRYSQPLRYTSVFEFIMPIFLQTLGWSVLYVNRKLKTMNRNWQVWLTTEMESNIYRFFCFSFKNRK